jgi:hypothetical protein
MKILRLSAMALAAALGCALGCGGSSSSCGGTNINQNSNTPVISCGPGTQQQGGVCVLSQAVNTK